MYFFLMFTLNYLPQLLGFTQLLIVSLTLLTEICKHANALNENHMYFFVY